MPAGNLAGEEGNAGDRLHNLIKTDNIALRDQLISLQVELSQTEGSVAVDEAATNIALYRLYALTKDEIALLEQDRPTGLT